LHLTQKNISGFSETLDSILNQEVRFADMIIINEVPNVEFDIRTLNTKIIQLERHNSSNFFPFHEIYRGLGNFVIYGKSRNSSPVFPLDFCKTMETHQRFLEQNLIVKIKMSSPINDLIYCLNKNKIKRSSQDLLSLTETDGFPTIKF